MRIAVDRNQTIGSHEKSNAGLHKQLENLGCELSVMPLPFGDYCLITDEMQDTINRRGDKLKKADLVGDIKISCDRKNSILELAGNICGKSHARFRDEVILASKCGCKLYIVVEDDGGYVDRKKTIYNKPVRSIDDLFSWKNSRAFIWKAGKQLYPNATKGATLAKACLTMKAKYGCEFVFCSSKDAGEMILKLLSGEET